MSMTAETIVERRRLRRKVTFWRVVAVIAVIAAIAGIVMVQESVTATPHIARVPITGFIAADRKQLELLDRIADQNSVRAVIVAVDSPGGSTAGGEAIYDAIRRISEKKPVVATMGTMATSAGYMISVAADRVIARRSTITGSIGVLFQMVNAESVLQKVGVEFDTIKSAPLKAEPTFYKPIDPAARTMIQGMIDDSYNWFVDIVAERRSFEPARAKELADGRVVTGRQALDLKLVDELGGEKEALAWLRTERGIPRRLKVRTRRPRDRSSAFSLTDSVAGFMLETLGFRDNLAGNAINELVKERLMLDGLVSVWQASSSADR